ncbi:MAG: glycosyltransferase family 2 protein [Sphingobacteriales bacterium]|nr:MAG: glycosyltransferase family 2 protein [Sphingobacteriales bacterium]
MQLSIIIINFNTFKLTCECIDSIKEHTPGLSYEIIVVDNAPKADYQQDFLSLYPDLVYIKSQENIGFGRANNLGMDVAKGDYFLLINSDTVVVGNCINQCYDFMEQPTSQHIGVVGCKLLNEDGSYQPSFYPYVHDTIWNYFITNNPILYKLLKVSDKYRETDETIQVGDISGAYMFMRADVVKKVKGFDPDFFLYCEETEWCRSRIAKHYDIYYYPEPKTVHYGGKSAPREPMYIQSKLSLALVWYKKGWGSYLLYFLATYANLFFYALTYYLTSAENRAPAKQYIRGHLKIFPYLFSDVIKYPRGYNCRKEHLVYGGAREIFFGKKK